MTKQRLLRERLLHPAVEVLEAAGRLGRVMLTTRQEGATHERLGIVERVEKQGLNVRLAGADHDAVVDPSVLGSIILDRSGKIQDKVLPRLDFHHRDGGVLFSLVGLGGLEPFDAGLDGLMGEATDPAEPHIPGERAEVKEGDIGAEPFAAACEAGAQIGIELRREGLLQRWSGRVEAVKPAMGFINIMRPDFHLHLLAGSVLGWRVDGEGDEIELLAHNAEGEATGLVVRGPAAVLATRPGI